MCICECKPDANIKVQCSTFNEKAFITVVVTVVKCYWF